MCKKLIYLISLTMLLIAAGSVRALTTVTTADGRGADTFVGNDSKSSPTATHGTATELECRYNGGDSRFRAAYLRFDLSDVGGDLSGATLTFEATYLKSTTGRVLDIYGLTDEALDLWNEGTTNYNNAPGMIPNPPTTLGNYAIDANLVLLGDITTPASGPPYPVRFSSNDVNLPLTSFLNADMNKLVTFVLINARGTSGVNCEDKVASKEHATYLKPSLTLPNAFPLRAYNPNPATGSIVPSTTSVLLQWQPGAYADKHKIYFGTSWTDVNDGSPSVYKGEQNRDVNSFNVSGLSQGINYYWRIDEVNSNAWAPAGSPWKGTIWNFKILPTIAWDPTPPDGAGLVAPKITLRWRAGSGAVSGHKVYLDTTNPPTTLRATLAPTSDPNWSPAKSGITLGLNTTYYWRIDEYNGGTTYTGSVWQFMTVPTALPDPNFVGWWRFDENANDSSGHWYNGTATSDLIPPILPAYIDDLKLYTGGREIRLAGNDYKQYVDLPIGTLISSLTNSTFALWVNVRARSSTLRWQKIFDFGTSTTNYVSLRPHESSSPPTHFEIKAGGVTNRVGWGKNTAGEGGSALPLNEWHHVAVTISDVNGAGKRTYKLYVDGQQVGINTQCTLTPSSTGVTTSNWLGKSIDLTIGGLYLTGYLDDFRIYDRELSQDEIVKMASPSEAWRPSPADGATDVEPTPTLSWKPGVNAAKHDVYFGGNFDDVNSATTSSPAAIYKGRQDPNKYPFTTELNWGQTYYWRIDEVNDPNFWRGSVWSFTVRNFLAVDDFEDYNNTSGNTIIWEKWIKGGGGMVGYPDPNYAELTIVHAGAQSMPLDYNNTKTPYYSEAARTFDTPQNWTGSGSNILKALSLWFRGYPASVGSFTESPVGTYTITASGADIWDVPDMRHPSRFHDEFHYAYKEITAAAYDPEIGADVVTIIAKVESITNTHASAKAGVMIRDSLDPNSTHGLMDVMYSAGDEFLWRLETSGDSDANVTSGITAPYWVKLVLDATPGRGNLRAYHSSDGIDWTRQVGVVQQISTMTLPRTSPIYVGLAVCAHNASATCTAVFSNVTITGTGVEGAWKHQDIGIKSNVASPLYVSLQDSDLNTAKVTYTDADGDPDANAVLNTAWQQWNIPLSDFAGVDPTKINKMTVGVGCGSADGTGTIYVDDIRLYVPRCMPDRLRSAVDFTGSDCTVDYQDLAILTNNWLISDYQVTPSSGWDPNTDPNLVGYYKFEGNFDDSSGEGNNGDPCNTGVTTITDPTRGKVASFDGIDDYFAITRLVQDDFTLTAWIKTDTAGAQAGTRAWQGSGLIWSDVSGSASDFILALLGTNLSFGTGPANQDTTSSGDVVTGQWVHVAVTRTRSSGRIEFFIDGILDTTAVHSNTGSLNANPEIHIGGNTVDSRYYTGLIDDVRIYSRVLSQGEVAYLAGKTTPFTQPLSVLLTNPAVNLYDDGTIDLRDYATFADEWLELLLWPQ
jgi:hypothetical protein